VVRRAVVPALLASLILVVAVGSFADTAAPSRVLALPTATELRDQVVILTSADMAGRGSGTAGADRAARRIADWLADAGLRPGGDSGSFLQWFAVSTAKRVATATALEMTAPRIVSFVAGRQWTPHGGAAVGEATGEVVFAGHGVSMPGEGYDDYEGIDARGRIVLALSGAPPHLVAGAPASRLEKLIRARTHGAAALLLVSDALPGLDATATPVGLLSGAMTTVAADALLAPTGRTVAALRSAIASTRRPASLASGISARIRVAFEPEERRTANVIGIVPGADPVLGSEAVVVAAHYDHLGVIKDVTYPGADDNASGTAVVVSLARAFARAARSEPPARTLVFALFSGEELGLLGSAHYVRQPAVPLARTAAMLNFDEVGRLRDQRLQIGGVDSGTGLRQIVEAAAANTGVKVATRGAPYAPSDHTHFYDGGVPVLFFHTGTHADYHAPTDTADRIDADGMALVAAMGSRVLQRLAEGGPPPVYARIPRERPAARSGVGGAFFGIAAHALSEDGVRLDSVVPGSAAEHAGMRVGDVVIRFAGASIESFQDLRATLQGKRPGDTVRVVYVRNGDLHETSATLGEQ
jgi:hypothetical protein